jgi:hypothetical protein
MFPYSADRLRSSLRISQQAERTARADGNQGLKLQIKMGRCIVLPEVKSGMGKG